MKFSGEFISEMESLNILGGYAEPTDTNVGYRFAAIYNQEFFQFDMR